MSSQAPPLEQLETFLADKWPQLYQAFCDDSGHVATPHGQERFQVSMQQLLHPLFLQLSQFHGQVAPIAAPSLNVVEKRLGPGACSALLTAVKEWDEQCSALDPRLQPVTPVATTPADLAELKAQEEEDAKRAIEKQMADAMGFVPTPSSSSQDRSSTLTTPSVEPLAPPEHDHSDHHTNGEPLALTKLSVGLNPLGDDGCESVAGLLRLYGRVDRLDLRSVGMGIAGMRSIVRAMDTGNVRVRVLDLSTASGHSRNTIGSEGFAALSSYLASGLQCTLEELHLEAAASPGLHALCPGLAKNRTLTYLDLRANTFEDVDFAMLCHAVCGRDPSVVTELELGLDTAVEPEKTTSPPKKRTHTKNLTVHVGQLRPSSSTPSLMDPSPASPVGPASPVNSANPRRSSIITKSPAVLGPEQHRAIQLLSPTVFATPARKFEFAGSPTHASGTRRRSLNRATSPSKSGRSRRKIVRGPPLSSLLFSRCGMPSSAPAGVGLILVHCITLTKLDLSHTFPTSSGSLELCKSFSRTLDAVKAHHTGIKLNLETLNLTDCKFGPAGTFVLMPLLVSADAPAARLLHLNLDYCDIGPQGAEMVGRHLASNNVLTALSLSHNSIGDKGLTYLVEAVHTNACLRELNLSNNGIGTAGARSFAAVLDQLHTLEVLDLSLNYISEDGAQALATVVTDLADIMRSSPVSLPHPSKPSIPLFYMERTPGMRATRAPASAGPFRGAVHQRAVSRVMPADEIPSWSEFVYWSHTAGGTTDVSHADPVTPQPHHNMGGRLSLSSTLDSLADIPTLNRLPVSASAAASTPNAHVSGRNRAASSDHAPALVRQSSDPGQLAAEHEEQQVAANYRRLLRSQTVKRIKRTRRTETMGIISPPPGLLRASTHTPGGDPEATVARPVFRRPVTSSASMEMLRTGDSDDSGMEDDADITPKMNRRRSSSTAEPHMRVGSSWTAHSRRTASVMSAVPFASVAPEVEARHRLQEPLLTASALRFDTSDIDEDEEDKKTDDATGNALVGSPSLVSPNLKRAEAQAVSWGLRVLDLKHNGVSVEVQEKIDHSLAAMTHARDRNALAYARELLAYLHQKQYPERAESAAHKIVEMQGTLSFLSRRIDSAEAQKRLERQGKPKQLFQDWLRMKMAELSLLKREHSGVKEEVAHVEQRTFATRSAQGARVSNITHAHARTRTAIAAAQRQIESTKVAVVDELRDFDQSPEVEALRSELHAEERGRDKARLDMKVERQLLAEKMRALIHKYQEGMSRYVTTVLDKQQETIDARWLNLTLSEKLQKAFYTPNFIEWFCEHATLGIYSNSYYHTAHTKASQTTTADRKSGKGKKRSKRRARREARKALFDRLSKGQGAAPVVSVNAPMASASAAGAGQSIYLHGHVDRRLKYVQFHIHVVEKDELNSMGPTVKHIQLSHTVQSLLVAANPAAVPFTHMHKKHKRKAEVLLTVLVSLYRPSLAREFKEHGPRSLYSDVIIGASTSASAKQLREDIAGALQISVSDIAALSYQPLNKQQHHRRGSSKAHFRAPSTFMATLAEQPLGAALTDSNGHLSVINSASDLSDADSSGVDSGAAPSVADTDQQAVTTATSMADDSKSPADVDTQESPDASVLSVEKLESVDANAKADSSAATTSDTSPTRNPSVAVDDAPVPAKEPDATAAAPEKEQSTRDDDDERPVSADVQSAPAARPESAASSSSHTVHLQQLMKAVRSPGATPLEDEPERVGSAPPQRKQAGDARDIAATADKEDADDEAMKDMQDDMDSDDIRSTATDEQEDDEELDEEFEYDEHVLKSGAEERDLHYLQAALAAEEHDAAKVIQRAYRDFRRRTSEEEMQKKEAAVSVAEPSEEVDVAITAPPLAVPVIVSRRPRRSTLAGFPTSVAEQIAASPVADTRGRRRSTAPRGSAIFQMPLSGPTVPDVEPGNSDPAPSHSHAAAVRIQKVYRGHMTRKRTRPLLKTHRVNIAAATDIQRVWRGHRTRRTRRHSHGVSRVVCTPKRSRSASKRPAKAPTRNPTDATDERVAPPDSRSRPPSQSSVQSQPARPDALPEVLAQPAKLALNTSIPTAGSSARDAVPPSATAAAAAPKAGAVRAASSDAVGDSSVVGSPDTVGKPKRRTSTRTQSANRKPVSRNAQLRVMPSALPMLSKGPGSVSAHDLPKARELTDANHARPSTPLLPALPSRQPHRVPPVVEVSNSLAQHMAGPSRVSGPDMSLGFVVGVAVGQEEERTPGARRRAVDQEALKWAILEQMSPLMAPAKRVALLRKQKRAQQAQLKTQRKEWRRRLEKSVRGHGYDKDPATVSMGDPTLDSRVLPPPRRQSRGSGQPRTIQAELPPPFTPFARSSDRSASSEALARKLRRVLALPKERDRVVPIHNSPPPVGPRAGTLPQVRIGVTAQEALVGLRSFSPPPRRVFPARGLSTRSKGTRSHGILPSHKHHLIPKRRTNKSPQRRRRRRGRRRRASGRVPSRSHVYP